MASKQVGDLRRRKHRHRNEIVRVKKSNKRFHKQMGQPGGVCIDIPETGNSDWINGFIGDVHGAGIDVDSLTQGRFKHMFGDRPPTVTKATFTTPEGEVKDLSEMPTYLELINSAHKN